MKKCLLIDNNNSTHILYFKEVFNRWNINCIVCSSPESALIRLNIDKPDFVLLCVDLEIHYPKIINVILNKNISLILYGKNASKLPYLKETQIKGIFPEPWKIDLFKLKAVFFADEDLKNDLYSENPLNIKIAIHEKVCFVKIDDSVTWEQMHLLKYQLINLLTKGNIIGIILIFQDITQPDIHLFENIEPFLNLINQLEINPSLLQLITDEEKIKTMIKVSSSLSKIEFSNSLIEAFLKILGKDLKQKDLGIWIFSLNDKTFFKDNMYDEFGDLVKRKGLSLNAKEMDELSQKNIFKLYTAKELALLGKEINVDYQLSIPGFSIEDKDNLESPKKKTVLIIDDDAATLDFLKRVLEKLDFEVIIASSGIDGFDYATSKNLDLIIVDLMMPGLNGIDLITNYKELRAEKAVPIIVASSISMKEVIKPLLEMGVDYIIKPIKISVLINKIEKVMK